MQAFDRDGTALNVVQLVGHGTLRIAAMGFARRPPTGAELTQMQRIMGDAMNEGAWGLSTGSHLRAGLVGHHRGDHRRRQGGRALPRLLRQPHPRGRRDAPGRGAGGDPRSGARRSLPVQVSHIKAAGRPNWGKVADALALIDEARAEGLDVMGDVYPYTASSTSLRTALPDWALEGGVARMLKRLADPGARAQIRAELEDPANTHSLTSRMGWEHVMISWCPKRKDAEGHRVSEIAAARRIDPLDAVFELLRDADGVASMILFQLDEARPRAGARPSRAS